MNVPPTEAELRMMHQMSGGGGVSSTQCGFDVRRLIVPTIAFVVLSLGITDEAIARMYNTTSGMHMLIKVGIFVVVLLLAQLIGMA